MTNDTWQTVDSNYSVGFLKSKLKQLYHNHILTLQTYMCTKRDSHRVAAFVTLWIVSYLSRLYNNI